MKIKNEYSFKDKLQLAWWLLRTKLQVPSARLIRYPFIVRGGGISIMVSDLQRVLDAE